ncbi:hypothetical protein P4O66_011394 [Electrophorus voltai]|uniref:SH3 and cysteine rich domain n=1 Tax=Electrophorus voltai TaxID=2609070 RepID=A0AAD8Z4L6_9TELE|nr:hypothetical protein P4O66_011394 [Electrophorus voltai]
MIPPASAAQSGDCPGRADVGEQAHLAQDSTSQHESKLQKLKRSLSFKTKSLRSKSADNFFQRPSSDAKLRAELLSEVSGSTGHLSAVGVSLTAPPCVAASPPTPPPPVPCGGVPLTICSPSRAPRPTDPTAHTFLEHTFKKPHFCDVCNHMIVARGMGLDSRLRRGYGRMAFQNHWTRLSMPSHQAYVDYGRKPTPRRGGKVIHKVIVSNDIVHDECSCQGGAGKVFGPNAKLGLRCKACKRGIHHKCLDGVGQQRCMGKLKSTAGCVCVCVLTSGLCVQTSDLAQVPEEAAAHTSHAELTRKHSDNVFTSLENGTENFTVEEKKPENTPVSAPLLFLTFQPERVFQALAHHPCWAVMENYQRQEAEFQRLRSKRMNSTPPCLNHTTNREEVELLPHTCSPETPKDLLQLNTCVALYRFNPQDNQDLEMRPGDRIIVADDSNEDWWKGVIDDRIGFFPSSFAHQVKPGDRVFRCNRTFIGCKEQGQITLKEGQICVSCVDEHNGFIRVASGKKRGFVPCDVLENV